MKDGNFKGMIHITMSKEDERYWLNCPEYGLEVGWHEVEEAFRMLGEAIRLQLGIEKEEE